MKPYIVAHRGSSKRQRENTLPAFELAIKQGADYVEFDVRRAADGVFVIHHDGNVGVHEIAATTHADLITVSTQLGYVIPTLEEVIALTAGNIKLDIELKEEGYEVELLEMVLANRASNSFVVTSFNESSIELIKHRYSDRVRCGLLLGRGSVHGVLRLLVTRFRELFPIARARRIGADFLAPHFRLLDFGLLRRSRRFGIPLWVWTIDDQELTLKLSEMAGIEAIITNVPDVAIAPRRKAT